jgi:tetratricopeptide (TPR) repeat protein
VAAEARTGLYRSVLAERRVLVVLDNARDSQHVLPLLPGGSGCLALVTSRPRLTGLLAAEGSHLVGIDVLTAAEVAARADFDSHAQQLPHALSVYLYRSGQWQEWADTMSTSLAAARRCGDVAAQGRAHHSIGAALTELGRLDEASAHLQDALVLFGRLGDHQGQGRAHNGIAVAFGEQRRFAESLEHARRAAAAHVLAGDRNGEATALNMMGMALTGLGDHVQALACCRRALEVCAETGNRELAANTKDTIGQAPARPLRPC